MLRLSRKHLRCKFKRRRQRGEVETEEESRPWSDLPALVLERIRASLDSDLYDLRLRSVCGEWRRSLAFTQDAYGFPIKVPPFPDRVVDGKSIHRYYLYLISPAEDLSHGWLVRSLGFRPNTFTVSKPLHPERVRCPLGTIDLLKFRISEVCSCFAFDTSEPNVIRRVVVVPYFVERCAVTVMVLTNTAEMMAKTDKRICYWNDHDPNWTYMDQLGHMFEDMIYFEGLFYAVDEFGALFSIDSSFNLTEVVPPSDILSAYYTALTRYYLIPYNSQLFLVALVTKEKYSAEPYERLVFKLVV